MQSQDASQKDFPDIVEEICKVFQGLDLLCILSNVDLEINLLVAFHDVCECELVLRLQLCQLKLFCEAPDGKCCLVVLGQDLQKAQPNRCAKLQALDVLAIILKAADWWNRRASSIGISRLQSKVRQEVGQYLQPIPACH